MMTTVARFATVINCFDGKIQSTVLDHVRTEFAAPHIDLITRPGALKHLSGRPGPTTEAILNEVSFSIERHSSNQIAVVGHHNCAGNPETDTGQRKQLVEAKRLLTAEFPAAKVLAIFLNKDGAFEQVI